MIDVLVFVKHADGKLENITAEPLIAVSAFDTLAAVVVGAPGTIAGLIDTLASYGTGGILAAESDDAAKYLIIPEVDVLVGLASGREAPVPVSTSATGREIVGRAAALTGSGLLSDVIVTNDGVSVKYSIFGGEYTVDGAGYGASPVYALCPSSVGSEEKSGPAEVTETSSPEVGNNAIEIASFAPAEGGDHPELTEAKLIVSGGRGVASEGGFKNVVELTTNVLGVAVSASRAAVDIGYYSGQFQVGQTGKIVSPDLYLALGISGAIQHKAGMQTSKTIVVVSKDEKAPLFEIADFGVVGDLFDVISQAIKSLK